MGLWLSYRGLAFGIVADYKRGWRSSFYQLGIGSSKLAVSTPASNREIWTSRHWETLPKTNQGARYMMLSPYKDPAFEGSTPQDFGFPEHPNRRDAQVWEHQEAFLEAYRKCGRKYKAATACGLTLWAIENWQRTDRYGILKRMSVAHSVWIEDVIESNIDEVCLDTRGNHDILRIFRAKAENREKYGDNIRITDNVVGTQMLDKLRQLAAQTPGTGAIVEGTATMLPDAPPPDSGS